MEDEQDKADYEVLCSRVEAIDKEAAKWLREVAPTYGWLFNSFMYRNELSKCFIWKQSPQGNEYWLNINYRLIKVSEEAKLESLEKRENITVATFAKVAYKRKNGKDLTALEQFVYDNCPEGYVSEKEFMVGLQAAIDEVTA